MATRQYTVYYTTGKPGTAVGKGLVIPPKTSALASEMWVILEDVVKDKYGPKAKLVDWEMDC